MHEGFNAAVGLLYIQAFMLLCTHAHIFFDWSFGFLDALASLKSKVCLTDWTISDCNDNLRIHQ